MKFTDRFFEFPIKIYDGMSVRKMLKSEASSDIPQAIDDLGWVRGRVKLPYWALDKLFYYDSFSEGRTPEEVAESGFDMTTVIHSDFGEFECMWKKEIFEKRLNDFTELYESENEEEIKGMGLRESE
jgi:hypothetical protein